MSVIGRLGEAAEDWQTGRGYGYPRCCVAHYCWDVLVGRGPMTTRYGQIRYDWAGPAARWDWQPRPWDGMEQIPCGVLHSKGSTFPLLQRAWRIVAFNLGLQHDRLELASPVRLAQVLWADDVAYDAWLTGVDLDRELEWS